MLLLIPIVLTLAVALVSGGSPRGLAELPARNTSLITASLLIQLLLYVPAIQRSDVTLHWGGVIYVGALGLAVIGALRNQHLGWGARIATIGLALNVFVIVLNGGYMPVNATALRLAQGPARVGEVADARLYGNTRLADRSTRLAIVADVFPVTLPGGAGNVYSVGDALIVAGIATLTFQATRRTGARRRRPTAAPLGLPGGPTRQS